MLVPATLNDSPSWAALNPLVIAAVAPARLVLSTSVTVSAAVTWVAASFSVYASTADSMLARTGGSLTGVTEMVRAWVLDAWLAAWPSSTWNVITRLAVVGSSLLL